MEFHFAVELLVKSRKEFSLAIFDENGKEILAVSGDCDDLAVPLELDPLADRFCGHPVLRERIELAQLLDRALESARNELGNELKYRMSNLILDYIKKQGLSKSIFAERCGIPYMKLRAICERTAKTTLPALVALVEKGVKDGEA